MAAAVPDTHMAARLVDWYEQNRRELPWRQTRDPYAIWVSETMLQQTRVETVIPYYHAFLAAFPTVRALAAAAEDEVLKRWQGLGYYSRARNLHRAAKQVVERHHGVIPDDEASFGQLPGVGPYTCGAVLSIAFGKPIPAVDGNVLRVMTRYLSLSDPIEQPAVKARVASAVKAWLDAADPNRLTQGLMELGATVCVPKSPRCTACPLQPGCAGSAAGIAEELPVRLPRRARKQVDVLALWIAHHGYVAVEQRPREGLLAGMWQLPAVEVERGPKALSDADKTALLRDKLAVLQPAMAAAGDVDFACIAQAKHVFTHIDWHVEVYRPLGDSWPQLDLSRCVPVQALKDLAWPRVYDRLIAELAQPLAVFDTGVVK
ncbi:A/G-specific adenine glycosylase [Alicyclobacillus cycloheptanicus]|uniref:Adenine DNA glycosylase n=1 Tax=Alicyclobacillus cycloheptanicus TaxID=1457 RepID=A0ABT9XKE0_9BACL|nr:A/G-specific adenine glycosylase [Alicyclobacillus cycloheptanicus]MDQ0190765.1 A/G-specific adenine glycosylase [Alicyclobacillus cycloheptanicus]WDL99851.1 A/G-specific adenine glycosylase [Alicyclobacillus cycloheptanicus]